MGVLLRKEGLYASHIANWRSQAALAILASLAPKKRGPPKDPGTKHNRALAERERELLAWKRRALRAEALVELQKASLAAAKVSANKSANQEIQSMALSAATELGVSSTCAALGVSRSTYYRELSPKNGPMQRRPSVRRLSDAERQVVLDALNEDRFIGLSPAAIHASLLDESRRICSVRTMYRILAEQEKASNRSNAVRPPSSVAHGYWP